MKRFWQKPLSLALALVMSAGLLQGISLPAQASAVRPAATGVAGDANGDGKLSVADLVRMMTEQNDGSKLSSPSALFGDWSNISELDTEMVRGLLIHEDVFPGRDSTMIEDFERGCPKGVSFYVGPEYTVTTKNGNHVLSGLYSNGWFGIQGGSYDLGGSVNQLQVTVTRSANKDNSIPAGKFWIDTNVGGLYASAASKNGDVYTLTFPQSFSVLKTFTIGIDSSIGTMTIDNLRACRGGIVVTVPEQPVGILNERYTVVLPTVSGVVEDITYALRYRPAGTVQWQSIAPVGGNFSFVPAAEGSYEVECRIEGTVDGEPYSYVTMIPFCVGRGIIDDFENGMPSGAKFYETTASTEFTTNKNGSMVLSGRYIGGDATAWIGLSNTNYDLGRTVNKLQITLTQDGKKTLLTKDDFWFVTDQGSLYPTAAERDGDIYTLTFNKKFEKITTFTVQITSAMGTVQLDDLRIYHNEVSISDPMLTDGVSGQTYSLPLPVISGKVSDVSYTVQYRVKGTDPWQTVAPVNGEYLFTPETAGTYEIGYHVTVADEEETLTYHEIMNLVVAEISTGTKLASDGKSEYAIVIPTGAGTYIQFAAAELQNLFREATGAELPVFTESNIGFARGSKCISIGDTKLQKACGVTCDYATFKESGARLFTEGNSVILTGASDEGALYAVYDFLKVLFDYEFYDEDAYTLIKKSDVSLPALDMADIPDLDYRMFGDYQQYDGAGGSQEHAFRLRYKTYGQGYAIDGHAATYILSESQYYTEHPDWFTANVGHAGGRQLCYTNEEMTRQFITNLEKLLAEDPDTTSVSIAQADESVWCTCDTCTAAIAQYGNGASDVGAVTQILFVNKVVKEVDQWLAVNYPGRKMTYMIMAYMDTLKAPAHKNENGSYVPNAPEMVLPDNVLVQYASVYTNRNIPFRDNPNESEIIEAWRACTSNLQIYEYPGNAACVCVPYDGLYVFKDNIKYAYDMGFSSYYMQGNFNTESSGFTPLKVYVASKLMWDSSLDTMTLAYDYIDHCYGDAAPYMRGYFDALRAHMAYLRDTKGFGKNVLEGYLYAGYWPLSKLNEFQVYFDQAYAAIEPLKTGNPDQYEVLFRKIMIEEMFLRYAKCELYLNKFSYDEKVKMIDELEYYAELCGFRCYNENADARMSIKIAEWRGKL